MTDEQINEAIAEACPDKFRNEDDVWFFQYAKDCWSQCHNNSICTDLNAMHEAEKCLADPVIRREYAYQLSHVSKGSTRFDTMHATARQRAEAFLRALGLWKTDQSGERTEMEVQK